MENYESRSASHVWVIDKSETLIWFYINVRLNSKKNYEFSIFNDIIHQFFSHPRYQRMKKVSCRSAKKQHCSYRSWIWKKNNCCVEKWWEYLCIFSLEFWATTTRVGKEAMGHAKILLSYGRRQVQSIVSNLKANF